VAAGAAGAGVRASASVATAANAKPASARRMQRGSLRIAVMDGKHITVIPRD
jgi:hypothetical protein